MKKAPGNILIVDDDKDILTALSLLLKREFSHVITNPTPANIPQVLSRHDIDLILLDMNYSDNTNLCKEGFIWLKKIRKLDPTILVVVITAYGDINTAVEAMKHGAIDFIVKPWQNEKLISTLKTAVALHQSQTKVTSLLNKAREYELQQTPKGNLIGESTAMQKVFDLIRRTAPTDANVMILGENGTGKELIARKIHELSLRSNKPFVSVDLGAISENLFESELFGHTKGAFTDAKENRMGRIQVADGGTVFLDEIGNLSFTLQAKLLTVLEQRRIIPLGTHKPVDTDFRLISATNMNPNKLTEGNIFRQDLRYRMNTVEINIPPLRERGDDVLLILDHFIRLYAKKYNQIPRCINKNALKGLKDYSWPGNIRELRHVVERATILSSSKEFQLQDFSLNTQEINNEEKIIIQNLNLDMVEKTAIKKALELHNGNISKAAQELGVTRTSLYRRLKKYDL